MFKVWELGYRHEASIVSQINDSTLPDDLPTMHDHMSGGTNKQHHVMLSISPTHACYGKIDVCFALPVLKLPANVWCRYDSG